MLEMHFHEMSEYALACKGINEILVTCSHRTLAVIENSITMS